MMRWPAAGLAIQLAACLPLAAAPPGSAASGAPEAGWERIHEEMLGALKALLRLDTSNPPGNELPAAELLKGILDRDGIESRVLVSTGARASLVARLRGGGKARPLMLMCHTDVVPAERSMWTVDPFGGVERDGFVYGRGAADAKGLCAAELAALLALRRRGLPLERDVVFLAQADEESGGGDRHIHWLLREHGRELDAEYAVNEGGVVVWDGRAVTEVRVQAAEKQYVDVRLAARGTPGHSSVPRPDNPVSALSRAIARLSSREPQPDVRPLVLAYLRGPVLRRNPAWAPWIEALEGPGAGEAARRLAAASADIGAMLGDTCTPTVLRAGIKSNVVPSAAEAVVNCRLMPGRDPAAFLGELSGVMAEPAVEALLMSPAQPAAPESPVDTPLMEAVREAVAAEHPDAEVSPFMSAWSTDAVELRARGTVVYGLGLPMTEADAERAHGHDERVSVAALKAAARLIYRVAARVAAPRRHPAEPRLPGADDED